MDPTLSSSCPGRASVESKQGTECQESEEKENAALGASEGVAGTVIWLIDHGSHSHKVMRRFLWDPPLSSEGTGPCLLEAPRGADRRPFLGFPLSEVTQWGVSLTLCFSEKMGLKRLCAKGK